MAVVGRIKKGGKRGGRRKEGKLFPDRWISMTASSGQELFKVAMELQDRGAVFLWISEQLLLTSIQLSILAKI